MSRLTKFGLAVMLAVIYFGNLPFEPGLARTVFNLAFGTGVGIFLFLRGPNEAP